MNKSLNIVKNAAVAALLAAGFFAPTSALAQRTIPECGPAVKAGTVCVWPADAKLTNLTRDWPLVDTETQRAAAVIFEKHPKDDVLTGVFVNLEYRTSPDYCLAVTQIWRVSELLPELCPQKTR